MFRLFPQFDWNFFMEAQFKHLNQVLVMRVQDFGLYLRASNP